MAHVQIRSRDNGGHTLLVDGHDLSMDVLANSLRVTFPEEDAGPPYRAHVSFTVVAEALDVDLPDAVVDEQGADA